MLEKFVKMVPELNDSKAENQLMELLNANLKQKKKELELMQWVRPVSQKNLTFIHDYYVDWRNDNYKFSVLETEE